MKRHTMFLERNTQYYESLYSICVCDYFEVM